MPVPSAPTGLIATSNNRSVYLNWTAPSNGGLAITDYIIQRKLNGRPDSSFATVPDGIKATPGSTIVGTNGVSYVFRVAAKNAAGVGPYSANSAPVTPSTIPSRPTAPTCVSGNGQITVRWVAPANGGAPITDYAIQRKLNGQPDTAYVNLFDGVSAATTYVVTGSVNGVAHVFRVAAINAKGASLWSPGSLPIVASAAPAPPTNLTAISGNGSITLNWTASVNNGAIVTDYIVQRKLNGQPDSSFAVVADGVRSTTTATIASANGVSYVFRVAGVNIRGVGAYSVNSQPVASSSVPSQCAPPICTRGFSQVTLNWSPPADGGAPITDYVIQRKISGQPDSTYVFVYDNVSSNTSHIVTGLTNGVSYVFRIAAVNVKGVGPWSAASSSVIPGALPPGAPTNLVATIVNETGVSLSWTAPTNNGGAPINRYIVQARSQVGLQPWRTVSDNYAPGVSLPIDGLDDVATIFIVAAVNAAGAGAYSNVSNPVTPSNKLFDKSSWRNLVAEPYLSLLNRAADRWYKFIRYNSTNRAAISFAVSGWNGLRLASYNLYNNPQSTTIASCSLSSYLNLGGGRFNSVSFSLNINNNYESTLSNQDWVNVLTHELGHALGIGVFWSSGYPGATPPSNFFLSGTAYPLAQTAYNSITGLTRSLIPLENTGGSGTSSGHWEDNFRLSSAPGSLGVSYPGLSDELMVGYYNAGMNLILSRLTIKTLVDFGWEEINANSSEGNPTLVTSSTTSFVSRDHCFRCGFLEDRVEPISIGNIEEIIKDGNIKDVN